MKQYETPCMIVIAVANVIATSGGMTAGSGTGTSCDLLPGEAPTDCGYNWGPIK